MTRQLSSIDLLFLRMEDATHYGHVAGVSVLDPSTCPDGRVTAESLGALIAGRLHLVPALRRRLVPVPLGIDRPYWVTEASVDMADHLREATLPAPGDDLQLADLVGRLHARPLDRGRPLWEIHLIHGLAGGRQAVYGKVHHSVVDGVTGGEILGILLDRSPDGVADPTSGSPVEGAAEAEPGRAEMLRRGLRNMAAQPAGALRALPRLLPHLEGIPGASGVPGSARIAAVAGRAARVQRYPAAAAGPVPRTPFNRRISGARAFAFGTVPLAEVRAVRKAFGCTDNDVVLTLCTSALRRWLLDHGSLPEVPLIAGIPVSVRPRRRAANVSDAPGPGNDTGHGNQVSLMVAPLPTHLADPAERLSEVASAMFAAKRRFSAMPDGWLSDMTDLVPAPLAGLAVRAISRTVNLTRAAPVNLLISNVPGPPLPLYMAGARMLAHHPVSAISDTFGGLNMTVVRYSHSLDFGLVACPSLVPDLWDLADHLGDALAELKPDAQA